MDYWLGLLRTCQGPKSLQQYIKIHSVTIYNLSMVWLLKWMKKRIFYCSSCFSFTHTGHPAAVLCYCCYNGMTGFADGWEEHCSLWWGENQMFQFQLYLSFLPSHVSHDSYSGIRDALPPIERMAPCEAFVWRMVEFLCCNMWTSLMECLHVYLSSSFTF